MQQIPTLRAALSLRHEASVAEYACAALPDLFALTNPLD